MFLMTERSYLGMGKYSDKNVVITGGSSGMGLALAELLVQGGARVVITGCSPAKLDAARERLGENAVAVRADVASLSDLDMLAGRVNRRHEVPVQLPPEHPRRRSPGPAGQGQPDRRDIDARESPR